MTFAPAWVSVGVTPGRGLRCSGPGRAQRQGPTAAATARIRIAPRCRAPARRAAPTPSARRRSGCQTFPLRHSGAGSIMQHDSVDLLWSPASSLFTLPRGSCRHRPAESRRGADRRAAPVRTGASDVSAGADGDESVDGAIGSTAQIGSTPNTARWSAMNWTIVATSSGGRAPPGRHTRTLSAGSHSPASAHGPRAPAPSTAPARSSSGPADAQHHAAPAAPTSAASPPCSRASAPPTAAPPTLRRGPPGAPRPSGRHVRALPETTDLDVP